MQSGWQSSRIRGGIRMTRGVIGRIILGVWLGSVSAAAAQLPPDILADKYLRQAEQRVEEKDYAGARKAMEQLLALQQEHGLEPDFGDYFRYAKVWSSAGVPSRAIEAAERYLRLRGRDAEHYEEALDLINQAESEMPRGEAVGETPVKQSVQAPPARTSTKPSGHAARRPVQSPTETGAPGTDYSECAKYFNNAIKSQHGETYVTYHWVPMSRSIPKPFRILPFDLQSNGSIRLHEDVVLSSETRAVAGGTETIIHYKSLPVDSVQAYDRKELKRTAKAIVVRDRSGNITEIIEDQNLSSEELDAMRSGSQPDDRHFAYLATRTEIEIKNGQCVPVKSVADRLRTTSEGDEKTQETLFYTPLCRDVFMFLAEHRELYMVLEKNLNKSIADNFEKYAEEILSLEEGYEEFHKSEDIDRQLNSLRNPHLPINSLVMQLFRGHRGYTELPMNKGGRYLSYPFFQLLQIMSLCYDKRLWYFFNRTADEIWQDQDGDNRGTISPAPEIDTATETGAAIGGSGRAGDAAGDTGLGTTSGQRSGRSGVTARKGICRVPGYPNPPGGVANLGFSWCPGSVSMQVRAFALQAAGAECAIATGSSSTPEQIEARRREIQAACDRLAALGQGDCQCPPGLGQ